MNSLLEDRRFWQDIRKCLGRVTRITYFVCSVKRTEAPTGTRQARKIARERGKSKEVERPRGNWRSRTQLSPGYAKMRSSEHETMTEPRANVRFNCDKKFAFLTRELLLLVLPWKNITCEFSFRAFTSSLYQVDAKVGWTLNALEKYSYPVLQ